MERVRLNRGSERVRVERPTPAPDIEEPSIGGDKRPRLMFAHEPMSKETKRRIDEDIEITQGTMEMGVYVRREESKAALEYVRSKGRRARMIEIIPQ